MSRTDINPSQNFSTSAAYDTATSFWNPTTKKWGATTYTHSTNVDTSGSRNRRGVTTVGFMTASDTGSLPENTFSYAENLDIHFRGVYQYETSGAGATRYEANGTFPDAFCFVPTLITIPSALQFNLDNKVKQRVLEKIKDQDVNLGIVWGERQQTIDLISDALSRLGKSYAAARHGDFKKAATILGNFRFSNKSLSVANSWLELQFGWKPLMSDIYGACKTLQKQMTHKEYVIVRYGSKIQDSSQLVSYSGVFTDFTDASAIYQSSCRAKMKSTSMFLKTASELGLTNPAAVAWELVHFSFVVDWAIPIGSFLSQFDSSLGWTFSSGSITRALRCQSVKTRSITSKPSNYVYLACDGRRDNQTFSVSRTGISSWLGYLTIPYVKNPLTMTHALDALALLTQRR